MNDTFIALQERLLQNFDKSLNKDGVSGERLAGRLHEIAQIGLTTDEGSNRPGYSLGEKQAKELVAKWMKEAGLSVSIDGAGNVFGKLAGTTENAKTILSGSHVDSVPNGGHFDGPLGVLCALEVVEAWKSEGYKPQKSYEVVIFSDEEGSRFNIGFHGSEAVIDKGDINEKLQRMDTEGLSFTEVLESVDLTVDGYTGAVRNMDNDELFVEVHIEQGKKLEKEDLPCGIVTGIVGPCWMEFTFSGEAGHAGNTPMNDRKDALVAASEFITKIPALPVQYGSSAVATIGKIAVKPNGVNVIPGEVSLYVDIRDIDLKGQKSLIADVIAEAEKVAQKHGVGMSYVEENRIDPVPINGEIQNRLEQAFNTNGIRAYRLSSGAGHDAMVLGEKIPMAMIFVRSKDGISHNPKEWSDLNDCVQGVHVLKSFIEQSQLD